MIVFELKANYSRSMVAQAIIAAATKLGWFCSEQAVDFRVFPEERTLETTAKVYVLKPKSGIASSEKLTVELGPIKADSHCHEFGVALRADSGNDDKAFNSPNIQVPVCDLLKAIQQEIITRCWGNDRD